MIFVEDPIQFSRLIKPICIFDPSINHVEITEGWTVGWGQSEDKSKLFETTPRKLKVQILSNEACFLKYPVLARLSSTQTFCAGTDTGAGVCNGDSGSGLFVSIQNRLYLAGIVSASLSENSYCDVNRYAIFTNTVKVYRWIEQTISSGSFLAASVPQQPQTALRVENSKGRAPTRGSVNRQSFDGACGVMSVPTNLVQSGRRALVNQWPFSVAIYQTKSYGPSAEYVTGTLISPKLVFSEPYFLELLNPGIASIPQPEDFKLILGIHDLDDISFSAEIAYVDRVFVHPNYDSGSPIIIANIALLLLKKPATLSVSVVPICIWDERNDVRQYYGQSVVSVGFGADNRANGRADKSRLKKYVPMTIKGQSDCPTHYQYYLSPIRNNENFFCAISGNTGTTCFGDSFTLYKKKNDRWFLFAVGSFLSADIEKKICDDTGIALYESISVYANWLAQAIKSF